MSVLDDEKVRDRLRQAWEESRPGADDAHEEGGFVLRNPDGSLTIERWPRGLQDQIVVPPHEEGNREGLRIVATFHTHPNFGLEFQQEPSLTDIRAVRDDQDLHHPEYEGEYVIARNALYRILHDGRVELLGDSRALLSIR